LRGNRGMGNGAQKQFRRAELMPKSAQKGLKIG
jgi:hypothetical protein